MSMSAGEELVEPKCKMIRNEKVRITAVILGLRMPSIKERRRRARRTEVKDEQKRKGFAGRGVGGGVREDEESGRKQGRGGVG